MENFEIAKIVKPQGIKGDVKVQLLVSQFDFANKLLYLDGKEVKVERAYNVAGGVALKLNCVNSRNDAETFRGKILCASRESIKVPAGKFLVGDLLNQPVFLSDNKEIGKIVDVLNYGSADVFVIKTKLPKQYVMASHKQGLIECVNKDKVVFNSKIFGEVSVYYED